MFTQYHTVSNEASIEASIVLLSKCNLLYGKLVSIWIVVLVHALKKCFKEIGNPLSWRKEFSKLPGMVKSGSQSWLTRQRQCCLTLSVYQEAGTVEYDEFWTL